MSLDTLNLNITEDAYKNAGHQPIIPQAAYTVSIYAMDIDTVKQGANKGKPRLKFQFKVAEGEQASRKIYHDVNAYSVEKNGQVYPPFELLDIGKAIGLSREEINSFNKGDWLGRNLKLTIVHEQKTTRESGYKDPMFEFGDDGEKIPVMRAIAKHFRSLDSAAVSASANAGTSKGKSKYSL